MDRLTESYRRRHADDVVEPFHKKKNTFCTEFVGALFEWCGVFDQKKGPYKSYYMPSDFTFEKLNHYLTNGYRFDNEGWELQC